MLFRLLEVITPVPAFGLEIVAFALDFLLDISQFFLRFGKGRCPELVEQVVYVFLVFRHTVFQCHRGIVFVPHQSGFFQTGGNQVAHHLLVVGIVSVISPVDIGFINALAQAAVVGVLRKASHWDSAT